MNNYFDGAQRVFLDARLHTIPDCAVSVSVEDMQAFIELRSAGHALSLVNGKIAAEAPLPLTALQVEQTLRSQVNALYQGHMSAIADGYPQYERESWPVQLQEAQDYTRMGADAATPWVDACAAPRGLARAELVERILAKDAAYRQASGTLTGIRQQHEDAIGAIAQLQDQSAALAQLNAYDLTTGWPVPDEVQE